MIRGLVVGKFAPLHSGHQFLISTARSQCHDLLILSYTSRQFPGCNAMNRRRWLEREFPDAHVVVLDETEDIPDDDSSDETQRNFAANKLLELNFIPTHVFSSEEYGPGFAVYLTDYFHQPVIHVSVDQSRVNQPISATHIRENVHHNRHWLPGHVYADFVRRVAFIGAESTGKSTLAYWLSQRLQTKYVAEYGRELWIQKKGHLTYDDMLHIAKKQIEIETLTQESANRYLICDTTPLTTLFYCLNYFGRADPRLAGLARRHYDRLLLLNPDFPLVQDGTRQDEEFRLNQHHWYLRELMRRNQTYTLVSGGITERQAELLDMFSLESG